MIQNKGFEVRSEEDYFNEIIANLKKDFPDMSDSPSNLLVIFARMVARNENRRDYDILERYSGAYVSTATGDFLNKAVRTAGITRIEGQRAIGHVTITKDTNKNQLLILPNMKIKSNDTVYETVNDSTIIMNTPTLDLEIRSVEVGSDKNIPNNSKFNTIENILGIKSIIANTEIKGGSNMETDAALRSRYFLRISSYSNSSLKGIIDRVNSVIDVTRVNGVENNSDLVVDGLEPHSFIIYAEGGTNNEIAEAIFETKPAGIETNGDISEDITLGDVTYQIKFSRFSTENIYYKIEVAIDRTIAPVDIEQIVKDTIKAYTNSNQSIIGYELLAYLIKHISSVNGVRLLHFGKNPNPTTDATIVADAGKVFKVEDDDIEVVII